MKMKSTTLEAGTYDQRTCADLNVTELYLKPNLVVFLCSLMLRMSEKVCAHHPETLKVTLGVWMRHKGRLTKWQV